MSPEEKLEIGRKLIAEAEAEVAAKKRNWPVAPKIGMLFRHSDGEIYIASRAGKDCSNDPPPDCLVCVSDADPGIGVMYADYGADLFDGDEAKFAYLGHARDLIKIADDAHEPTGAELVGKVCQFSDDGKWWTEKAVCSTIDKDDPDATYLALGSVKGESGCHRNWFKYARLAP